jgi:hypothetical protein
MRTTEQGIDGNRSIDLEQSGSWSTGEFSTS